MTRICSVDWSPRMEVLKNFVYIFVLFVAASTVIAVLVVGTLFFYVHWPIVLGLVLGALWVAHGDILFGASVIVAGIAGQYFWSKRVNR
jgi:hypothetical protein